MDGPVCLIIPPSPFLHDERVFMSLGALKVAAALEREGIPVEVLDLSGVPNYVEAVRDHVRGSYARCYGISATSPQLPAAVAIADAVHTFHAGVPLRGFRVILGGPHGTLVNAAWKREARLGVKGRAHRALDRLTEKFDVIVAGDGERAILDALSAPDGAILDADDRRSPYWLGDADLDTMPFPARHLVDVGSYHYAIDGEPALSLIAQLGCPFGCGFCAGRLSPSMRHIRTRSADSIVAEMRGMHETYGTRGFMFYDDELNVSRGMVELMSKITLLQAELGVEFALRGCVKAELFTPAQAAAMRAAGFRQLLVGFESGSERILTNINKKATRADNTRCIAISRAHGIKVKALMSLGHPGESGATAVETYDWLIEAKPDDFDVTVITPYPGSPYYDEAELRSEATSRPALGGCAVTALREYVYTARSGDRLYQREIDHTREADYYKGVFQDGAVSHVWTDYLDPAAMTRAREGLERAVREKLHIPYPKLGAALTYEHSMGQTALPPQLLRSTGDPSHVNA